MKEKPTTPRSTTFGSLTPQLFIFIILPLTVVVLTITYGGLRLHQRAMRTLVSERDIRAVQAATSAIYEQIHHRQYAVVALALRSSADSSTADLRQLLEQSAYLLPDFDGGLAFFSSQGALLASTGSTDFWQAFAALPEGQRSSLLNGASPLAIVDPAPVFQDVMIVSARFGQPGVIAAGAFSPTHLVAGSLGSMLGPAPQGVAFLVSQDKHLLALLGEPVETSSLLSHPGVAEALAGESGSTFLKVNGQEHVFAYASVPQVGWALVLEEQWEQVASPLLRTTENAPLILIPLVLLAVLSLWFATHNIVEPLHNLEAKARALTWGDFSAIAQPVGGISEIRNLQEELAHMAEKLHSAQDSLKGYISVITQAQEDERRRLARELHDDTLQALIALNQRVQMVALSENGNLAVGSKESNLAEVQTLTEQTIQNLRRITRALRPIYLEDLGLSSALDMLRREMEAASGIQVTFQRSGSEKRLSAASELALYRITQEALSNVSRHAGATRAEVYLAYSDDHILLTIHDDGVGFRVPETPAEFVPSGHYGLLGIYERAEMIGARMHIESAPGKGTLITIHLPVSMDIKSQENKG